MEDAAQQNEILKQRIRQLEDELWDEQVAHDETRQFAMRRVDELIALGAWEPGVGSIEV